MNTYRKIPVAESGSTMIEVLVTLVILLVGLLGLAGMMLMSQRSELESYQRVQAIVLVQDMAGRINANRKVATCYALTATNGSPYLGTGYASTPTCTAGTATQNARAIADMQDWSGLLTGAAEKAGASKIGAMNGARGCINYDAVTDSYMVSVAWQGTASLTTPFTGLTCATGLYGSEDKRRVVSTRVKIGTLAATSTTPPP